MPYVDPEDKRRYAREWRAKRRAAYFVDKICAACGSVDQLQLDHIDPATKIHHSIWSWSAERREAELAKCQVLCKPCHDEKSAGEQLTGESNPAAKLTTIQVAEIREAVRRGAVKSALAREYGVDKTLIGQICSGKIWVHSSNW